jgi:hypothetical protein
MRTIRFNAANVAEFKAQLEQAKKDLVTLCEREVSGEVNCDISVDRYNMARQELKSKYPVEVIGMLDASGFINDILCEDEKAWIKARKEESKKRKGGRS